MCVCGGGGGGGSGSEPGSALGCLCPVKARSQDASGNNSNTE